MDDEGTDERPPEERISAIASADLTPEEAANLAIGQLDPDKLAKRPRGMFSHADRTHLWGLKDYAQPEASTNADRRVRERVVETIRDMRLLRLFDGTQIEKVFGKLDDDTVRDGAKEFIAFLYRGIDGDIAGLESIINEGVMHGENRQEGFTFGAYGGGVEKVETNIDVTYAPDADSLDERFRDKGAAALSPSEIGVLAQAGRLDADDLESIRTRPRPTDIEEDTTEES